ncbi:MAG TPA: DUF192 domain-containing protein, partial [Candidatus Diapherotrites archaeon]|nr:DUF192 domain-containing protein [Candidatus Diapherotrites archaeon]
GQIVYQKGDYKILRIDKPEDIVKFQELNDLHCWCIQYLDRAEYYGTAWFLYRRNSIVGVYTIEEKILRDRNDQPMKDPELIRVFIDFLRQEGREREANNLLMTIPMTKEEIDEYIDKGEDLDVLYRNQHHSLTPEQIDKALDIGIYLGVLYEHQKLTLEQLYKAIDIGKNLTYLYRYQKNLPPEIIDKAMDKGEDLDSLYEHQRLTPEQIDRAMSMEKHLDALYEHQTLTPEQVDRAMDMGKELKFLYKHQTLTPEQIDKAIEKGEDLFMLYVYKKLSSKQISRAIDIGKDLDYLYIHQKNMSPENIDKAMDKGIELGLLYENQDLTPEQIDRALDKRKDLWGIYLHQTLTPEQIDRAIDIGESLSYIYLYQKNITSENIDHAIDKGIDLGFLYANKNIFLTPEQKARIEKKLSKRLSIYNNTKPIDIFPFKVLKNGIKVFFANDEYQKSRGLIGIKKDDFKDNYVLIFKDIKPGTYFHMRGVEFPIDIAFITENLDIIDIMSLKPETGLCKAPENTRYVLEANRGWCSKNLNIIRKLSIYKRGNV